MMADNNHCRVLVQVGRDTFDLHGAEVNLTITPSAAREQLSRFTLEGLVVSANSVSIDDETPGDNVEAEQLPDGSWRLTGAAGKVRRVPGDAVKAHGLAKAALLAFSLDDDEFAAPSADPKYDPGVWMAKAQAGFDELNTVPAHLRHGLLDWVMNGRKQGSFLMAVICNDLIDAVHRGDGQAQAEGWRGLRSVVDWLHFFAPDECFGSADIADAWMAQGGVNG